MKIAALSGVVLVAAGLLAAPLRGHVDDSDAQLYQVLARNLAEHGAFLDPGPAPSATGPFREHLPFGLWPYAAATKVVGEDAQPFCALFFSLATVALVFWLGSRLASLRAGVAAALLLACTETFFLYGARTRLDPPLVLLSLASTAPVLLGGPMAWAALLAFAAVLVKGPFGLVPLVAVSAGRALVERRPRVLASGAAAALCAALPLGAFLLWDRARHGSWWTGYAERQIYFSLVGLRPDGETSPLFPLRTVAARFWPGLPFVVLGVAQALRVRLPRVLRPSPRSAKAVALLAAACTFGLCILALPARKVWNHALVLYPLLALLGGVALDDVLEQVPRRAARAVLPALAAISWAGFALGLGPSLLRPPCVLSREFRAPLAALPPGTPILLVGPVPDWKMLSGLAAEHRLSPWLIPELPDGPPAGGPGREGERRRARFALAPAEIVSHPPAPWVEMARARGYLLLQRGPGPQTATSPPR